MMLRFAFVFSGMGSQWTGMGRELLDTEPEFTRGFREFAAPFAELADWSPEKLVREAADITSASVAHPCILALEFGLLRALKAKDFTPELYMGHSGGEVAAAWAAGILSARDAAALAFRHSLLLKRVSGQGRMLRLAVSESEACSLIAPFDGKIFIAAVNSPFSVVCSGEAAALEALRGSLSQPDTARYLRTDVPFHAPGILPWLDEFASSPEIMAIRPRTPHTSIVSSLHGGLAKALAPLSGPDADYGAVYWKRHVSEPVRFAAAVERAAAEGIACFVELSPHAVLQEAILETCAARDIPCEVIGTLYRNADSAACLKDALTEMRSVLRGKSPEAPALSHEGRALRDTPGPERVKALRRLILQELNRVLPEPVGEAESSGRAFRSLGVNSLLTVRLRALLAERLGISLPVSALFNFPDADSLAGRLCSILRPEEDGAQAALSVDERAATKEPIAVVGVACRFPGGITNMDEYWEFLKNGRDAVIPIPADRWDREKHYNPDKDAPGTMYTREAAFLTGPIEDFDPFFFNMSAREATQLDPQQRLLLEMSWEAFENAAINPEEWRARQAGVFVALTNSEYSRAHRDSFRRERIDAYSLTGTTSSGACGRISYFFGFEGPCWSVDTACSSGLVALHCACRSLRSGESDLALAAGVTLMLTPDLHICFTKLGAISPDGRSKAFDDKADGYGRGEGGAVVILRRLSDAVRDKNNILGVIRGTAVNQDGRSNGLTAPNGLAQQKVAAAALKDAGLSPLSVSYVEAHGTGTALGDAIELDSLAAAYCRERTESSALRIGSVKANIGHLEPAAALASLLKVLLCFHHKAIPANIHIKTPNTRFDFKGNHMDAPTRLTAWDSSGPRRAGMSSFGFSGVNGHAVLEEYIPEEKPEKNLEPGAFLLPLSARTRESLRDMALACAASLPSEGMDLAAMCKIMACSRPAMPYRAAVTGADAAELATRLARASDENTTPVPSAPRDPVLLFTGQGSQYPNMGRDLYRTYPVFRKALDHYTEILRPEGLDLTGLMFGGADAAELERTSLSQPLTVAFSCALYELWTSFGLRFSGVAGHSIGEYSAAAAAGMLRIEDALLLAAARGRAMEQAPPGAMAAIFASEADIAATLAERPDLSLAAINAPRSLVVSGPEPAVDALLKTMGGKKLRVSRAFHSPAMREAAEIFAAKLDSLPASLFRPAQGMDFISTVSGLRNDPAALTKAYWARQITSPVRFADAVRELARAADLALECGPSAALSSLTEQNECGLVALPCAAPNKNGLHTLLSAAGGLFLAGLPLDFKALYAPFPNRHVPTPGYRFQRKRHWMPVANEALGVKSGGDAIPGERLDSPALGPAAVFQSVFSDNGPAFLHEHVIFDKAISPAAGHMAMLLAAARALWGQEICELRDIDFLEPLVVPKGESRTAQVIIDSPHLGESTFRLVGRNPNERDSTWTLHCSGIISRTLSQEKKTDFSPRDFFEKEYSKAEFYARFIDGGYAVGEGFQRVERISARDSASHCLVEIRRGTATEAGHVIYPGALDSVLQTILPSCLDELLSRMKGTLVIPMHMDRLSVWRPAPERLWCRSSSRILGDAEAMNGSVLGVDETGQPVLEISGLLFRMTDSATLYRQLAASPAERLYERRWFRLPPSPPSKVAGGQRRDMHILPLGDGRLARELADASACPVLNGKKALIDALTLDAPLEIIAAHSVNAAADTSGAAERENAACEEFLFLLQAAARRERAFALHLATSGVSGDDCLGKKGARVFSGSSLYGMAASFSLEFPGALRVMADLPLEPEHADVSEFFNAVWSGEARRGAVREGNFHQAKLARVTGRRTGAHAKRNADYSGTHFISGGSGVLALHTAEWLTGRGAEGIALFSRSGTVPPGGETILDALRAKGVKVFVLQGDVASRTEVEAALDLLRKQAPRLRGVFHAAGVLDDGIVTEQSSQRLRRVMRPKAEGVLVLHEATLGDDIRHFVCYSSAAALLGSPGQSNYAAANAFLNAFALWRAAQGLAASAPCWGPWSMGGMAEATTRRGGNLQEQGILPISPEEAFASLFEAEEGLTEFGVLNMDWKRFAASREISKDGYFSLLAETDSGSDKSAPQAAASMGILRNCRNADGILDKTALAQGLRVLVANLLGLAGPEAIALDKPLIEYGFDSLMTVRFRADLSRELQRNIPVSMIFEYPDLNGIAAWLCSADEPEKKSDVSMDARSLLDDIDDLLGSE